jgi:hypothetical protein
MLLHRPNDQRLDFDCWDSTYRSGDDVVIVQREADRRVPVRLVERRAVRQDVHVRERLAFGRRSGDLAGDVAERRLFQDDEAVYEFFSP